MRATFALRTLACRITLFKRQNCSLCEDARQVLSNVWDRRPFEFDEIDVMTPSQEKWKALYEFDTPVIHVDKTKESDSSFETTAQAQKLMHRFKEDQVESLMDKAMGKKTHKDEST